MAMAHLVAQLGRPHHGTRFEAEHGVARAVLTAVCHGRVLDVALHVLATTAGAAGAIWPDLLLQPEAGLVVVRKELEETGEGNTFAVLSSCYNGGCNCL